MEVGKLVQIEDSLYQIDDISQRPIQVDSNFPQYLLHVGGLSEGEWVYVAALDNIHGDNGMIVEAKIVVESIAPMHFVLN